jgi:hypothetical protein
MGATGWSYFVPYEADISAALQRLRENVFARGDYEYGVGIITDDQRKALLEEWSPDWKQRVREAAPKLKGPMWALYLQQIEEMREVLTGGNSVPRKPKRKPKTIEKLLELRGESGTHSILDIFAISSEPKVGTISPFPRAKLVEFFGSETPSHAKIEEAQDSGALDEFVSERWQGIYIIAYRNGSLSEIFFAGCSGD